MATERRAWIRAAAICAAGMLSASGAWLGWAQSGAAPRPEIFEPGLDPAIGVNLVSFNNSGPEGVGVLERGVRDVFDHGIRTVVIFASRFVDPASGSIRLQAQGSSGPALDEVLRAVQVAKGLGMTVTVNAFVEPDGFAFFRGQLRLEGAVADRFFTDYQSYLVEVATVAQMGGADRLSLGSELRDLTTDPRNVPRWLAIVDAVDRTFSGQLGYAANFDEYRNETVTQIFWENPKIDFLGVDAYNQLANDEQSQGAGRPDAAFLEQSWNLVFEEPDRGFAYGILDFASKLRGGAGLQVLLTEHGTIPFDRTTTMPFSNAGRNTNPPDPLEQRNDYEALLRASNGRAAVAPAQGRLTAIYLWRWGIPGVNDGDAFLLHPEGDDIREGAMAARFVEDFVKTAR